MSRTAPVVDRHLPRRASLLFVCLLLGTPSGAAAQLTRPAAQTLSDRRDVFYARDTLAGALAVPRGLKAGGCPQCDPTALVWPSGLAPADSRPGVWRYVGWGALIGGALTGGYAAYRSRDCDDCMFVGFFIGGATAVGAVLGGFVASLIYADRHGSDER